MSDSILGAKAKDFAKDIVFLCRKLKQNAIEGALINQLLRCGTSVGANVHTHKEQRILSQNLKSPKKNVTRVNIGLNCFLKQIL